MVGRRCRGVLTPREAADYLRVSRWAIYDAVAAGTLPAIRVGRAIRIPTSAPVPQESGGDECDPA